MKDGALITVSRKLLLGTMVMALCVHFAASRAMAEYEALMPEKLPCNVFAPYGLESVGVTCDTSTISVDVNGICWLTIFTRYCEQDGFHNCYNGKTSLPPNDPSCSPGVPNTTSKFRALTSF
jgi:hypothetical protein